MSGKKGLFPSSQEKYDNLKANPHLNETQNTRDIDENI